MTMSYVHLDVVVFNTDKTPNELRRAILHALPDDELEVCIEEHTGPCTDEFCGEHE